MHLMEESDHYDVFSESEKDEFIFRIFKHLCLGGDICQVRVKCLINLSNVIYRILY